MRGDFPKHLVFGLMHRTTMVAAAAFACSTSARAQFITLNDPLATNGTYATGISDQR